MAEEKRKILVEVEQNLDESAEHAGAFGGMLQGAKAAMMGLVGAAKAFIATPIGAIIGAITVVLAPLISFLTKTQAGLEKVRVVTAQASAAFDVIIDRISQVGKALFGFGRAIVQFFSGEFEAAAESAKQATEQLTTAFDDLGTEIAEEVKLAGELETALIALEKAENDFSLTRAKRETQIARLRIIAKDEQELIDDRIQALKEAMALEEENLQDALRLQKERVRIAKEDFDRAESTEADRKALIDERIKLETLEQQALNTKRRLVTELGTLLRKSEKENTTLKRIELDETLKIDDKAAESKKNSIAEQIKAQAEQNRKEKEITEAKKKRAAIEIKLEEQKRDATIGAALQAANVARRVVGENTAAGIALGIASAIANTYKAANEALASAPPPASFILAAATIAEGLFNVQQIIKAGQKASVPISGGGASFAVQGNSSINFTPDVVRTRQQTESLERGVNVEATVSVQEINTVQNRVKVKEGSSRI